MIVLARTLLEERAIRRWSLIERGRGSEGILGCDTWCSVVGRGSEWRREKWGKTGQCQDGACWRPQVESGVDVSWGFQVEGPWGVLMGFRKADLAENGCCEEG